MTAAGVSDSARSLPAPIPREAVGYWAMVLFCVTEATLFAYLIASYFYLGVSNRSWPPAGARPSLTKPLLMTVLLVSSSAVLIFAARARERGARSRYAIGTLLTILLGAGFLVLQVTEYRDRLPYMPPSSGAYASVFYLITGFHGTHVALGLLLLLWTLLADRRGRLASESPLAVKNSALYWHFVDAVWLVILTCLYLSPRWY